MIIAGSLSLLFALFLVVRPYLPGCMFAYFGMWLFNWSYAVTFSSKFFISWGVITVITIAIDMMQNRTRWQPVSAALYMTIGAIIGLLLGLSVGEYWLIPGCALGTLLATFAYAKTPAGKAILFSRSTFIQYFCAYGLRIIVTITMIGYVLGSLMYKWVASNIAHIN